MAQLSDFSPEDADVIVGLPCRVGLHISFSEDEDGEGDDAREMGALESCLREVAGVQDGEDLIRAIAAEVLRIKDEKHDSWSQGVFNITPQCERAVLLLKSYASAAEVKAYIAMVLAVASAVAGAHGEFDEEEDAGGGFFGKVLRKISGGADSPSSDPANVSAAEDDAIAAITAALQKNV